MESRPNLPTALTGNSEANMSNQNVPSLGKKYLEIGGSVPEMIQQIEEIERDQKMKSLHARVSVVQQMEKDFKSKVDFARAYRILAKNAYSQEYVLKFDAQAFTLLGQASKLSAMIQRENKLIKVLLKKI